MKMSRINAAVNPEEILAIQRTTRTVLLLLLFVTPLPRDVVYGF